MNPTTPTTPDSTPQQPVAPPRPLTPTPTPDPVPQAAPSVRPTSFNTTGSSAGGKKKFFLFGGIAVVVLALLSFFIVLPALASLQAKGRADGFMKAITTGDVTQAMTFVKNGGDAEDKAFLTGASEKVKGSYSYKESTKKDDKFYALFTLKAGAYISARTEMINDGGKWYLDGFVYDTKELALVPGNGATSNSTEADTTADTEKTASTLACLTQDDYKWFEYNKQPSTVTFDDTYDPVKITLNKTGDMFFKPDTTNEDSFTSVYDDWADFAKHNENKQWKFRLQGSTFGSDATQASGKKLANERSEKVKTELVKRGVPADRIVIDAPYDYSKEEQDAMADIYRRVQNTVDPTCTASTTTGSER